MKNRLMQLFRDNAKPSASFEIKAEGGEATIYLYDAIGGWWGIEASDFVKCLDSLEAETIHLRVNSPGGDVFDARSIATALKQHSAKIVAHIDGLAASAATYVSLAADEVEIADGAFFMIHNAWTIAIGNADDMIATAELLGKVDESIVKDYQRKTGCEEAQIKDWMAAETWFTAAEAVEHGFADTIFEGEDVENHFNLGAYANTPAALSVKDEQEDSGKIHRERFERRARLFEMGER